MQNDDLNLQISQASAKTVQYCERQSSLQQPHRLSAVETDDNGNTKFAVRMEKLAKEKMTGYIPSSLRSSVDNTVDFGCENTFSLDGDDLSVMSSSNSTVKYAATMTHGSRLMSAWNGDSNLLPERQNSVQPAGSMRKSCSFPTTLTQLGSPSVQRKSSAHGDQSAVADELTKAGAVLPQSSVSNSKSQSEMVSLPRALNVNAEIASEDARVLARHSALKTSGERSVGGVTTKSNSHRVRRSRNAASTQTSSSKQSTTSGVRNVVNETIVVENSQLTTSMSLTEVRPSSESTVDDDSNQNGTSVASSKLEQSRKPVSGIPDSKPVSSKLCTSRIPAGSKKRENSLKVSGNTLTAQPSGSRASRLSMTSSSSNISSQPTETKARASVSDCTKLGIPKPSGMFSK